MQRTQKYKNGDPTDPQDIFDIISGEGAVKVSVDVSFTSILYIFLAFVLANVLSRLIIK